MSVNDALKGRPLYTLSSDIFPAKEKSGRTAGSSITGAPALAVQKNAAGPLAADGQFSPLQVDANGALKVNVSSITPITSADIMSPLGPGTDATAVRITDGGNSITVDGTVGVNNYPAPLTVVNTGPSAAAQRVALADDSQVKLPEVTVAVGDDSTALPAVQGVAALAIDNNDDFAPLRTDASGNLKVAGAFSISNVVVDTISDLSLTEGATPVGTDRGVKIFAHEPTGNTYETLKVDTGGDLQVFSTNAKDVGASSAALRVALATGSSVAVSSVSGTVNVADGGGSLTVDGAVAVSSVGGTVTVDGTVDLGTDLTKTRDNVAGGTDKGVQIFSVRNDVAGALADTDGDYAPLQTDSTGNLRTTVANFPATQPVSGTVSVSGINSMLSLQRDSAQGATDYGIQALAVRQDTAGALVSTDGDYTPLQTNADGYLRTVTMDGNISTVSVVTSITNTVTVAGTVDLGTDLTKTRDVAAGSADKGIQILSVRNDVAGALAGTDGDYAPLQTDNTGNLRTTVANFPATQPVSGTVAVSGVGGSVTVIDGGGSLTVDGTVSIDNFPATQPVSGTVAVSSVGGTVIVGDGGGSLTVDGTVDLGTDLTKTRDNAAGGTDKGIQIFSVRNDVAGALADTDGDYAPLQTDNTGNLRTTVANFPATQPVSGTVAVSSVGGTVTVAGTVNLGTDLTKTRDDAAGATDKGMQILAVRNDTAGALVDTNGDYTPLQTDSSGRLRTTVGNLPTTLDTNISTATASTIRTALSSDSRVANLPSTVSTNINAADASTLRVAVSSDLAKQADGDVYAANDRGIQALAVRKDVAGTLVDATGDFTPLQTDSSGNLRCTVSGIDPGLSIQHGSAHNPNEYGIHLLTVRKDATGPIVSNDGEHAALITNSQGNLRTTVANLPSAVAVDSGASNSSTIRTVISSDLSKASAAAWSSGNQGIQALAVRNPNRDNLLVSTNQQYTPLSTDRYGSLRTNAGLNLDVAGRLEVAELFTLGDYRCVYNPIPRFMSSHESGAGNTIAHDTATNSLSLTLGGTNSGHVMVQTGQTHPYFAGKAQQCEFTMFNFHPQTGVKKRIGYFYHNNLTAPAPATDTLDGFYLECDGTTGIDLVCKRNGTDTVRVNQSAWNGDKLDGTGNSGVTINWQNFNVFCLEFLYLGGAIARLCVFVNGQIIVAHEVTNFTNNNANVIMGSPNQPFAASIHSTGANAGVLNFVCCAVNSKASAPNIFAGRPLWATLSSYTTSPSIGNFVPMSVGITLNVRCPILGVRLKNDAAKNRNISVFITEIIIGLIHEDSVYIIELVKNPTISGTILSTDLSTGIETLQLVNTTGQTISSSVVVDARNQIVHTITTSRRTGVSTTVAESLKLTRLSAPVNMANAWDSYWLCVTGLAKTNGLTCAIQMLEIK